MMPTTVPIPMYTCASLRALLALESQSGAYVAAPVNRAYDAGSGRVGQGAASHSSQLFLNLGPGSASTLDDLNDRHSVEAELMPFFVGNPLLKMVIDAIVGAYGLTYITLGVFMLIVYVLLQLRLV
jgi:hypothetical protein